jgi:hypothetical protein
MGGNVPQNDKGYMTAFDTKFIGLLTRFYRKREPSITDAVEADGDSNEKHEQVVAPTPTFNEWFLQASQAWKVCMYVCIYGWMDGWMDGCIFVRLIKFVLSINQEQESRFASI